MIIGMLMIFISFVVPFILTGINSYYLLRKKDEASYSWLTRQEGSIEWLTIILGIILSLLYRELVEILNMDWQEVLINNQKHTPISSQGQLTMFVLLCIGILGYSVLKYGLVEKLPPLVFTLAIACVYIGMILAIVWIIQVFTLNSTDFLLVIFPINCLLLSLKVIKETLVKWQEEEKEVEMIATTNPLLVTFNQLLSKSENWVWLGFVFMLPILGIVLASLVLLGQEPDAYIKAWTETSDWNLSEKISPPNVEVDEHYLCTVAASGHRNVVKPQRKGVRHGHEVVVNRQLCIANAFEQILEEKTPKIHRVIRGSYDKYGYPVARKITSPLIADIIYFLMKPAELLFLLVIYLVDIKPENRIALQYITSPKKQ
ncbi:MAG: DUF6688 family protein [Vagococcus sp.]|uniref:DUF6688 domain-containing protein n=1 Tax=Vagococcus sp. TaxID=1933889 RepID=UPI002FCB7ECC